MSFRSLRCAGALALFLLLAAGHPVARADVLWNNGPLLTHPGGMTGPAAGADRSAISPGDSVFGTGAQLASLNRVSDDFTAGPGWVIDSIRFFAYQTNSPITSTMTGATLRIWSGNPNSSSVVFGDATTNRMTGTGWTGMYRTGSVDTTGTARPIMFVDVGNLNLALPAGTYFLDWSLNGSLPDGPLVPAVSSPTTPILGNALQFTIAQGSFVPVFDNSGQVALPFIINGSVIPEPSSFMLLLTGITVGSLRRRRRESGTGVLKHLSDPASGGN